MFFFSINKEGEEEERGGEEEEPFLVVDVGDDEFGSNIVT
jgi:hypothetical protein